jgi:hypothetical protein
MSITRRQQMWCDREVQGALMTRVVMYWLFCLLTITLMLVCWTVISGPPRRFAPLMLELYQRYAPALAASLLVLPIVMLDVVRLSNRFVGPIKRLRDGMTVLAEGGEVMPMKFRDRDFWSPLADLFNSIAAKKRPALRKHPALLSTPVNPLATEPVELDRSATDAQHFFDDIVFRP